MLGRRFFDCRLARLGRGAEHEPRPGLRCAQGQRATIGRLQLGLLLILLVAGAGVGSLLLASELAFNVVKVLGALYLIYLGWCQWRAGGASPLAGAHEVPAGSWRKRCLTGFLTNATSPRASFSWSPCCRSF